MQFGASHRGAITFASIALSFCASSASAQILACQTFDSITASSASAVTSIVSASSALNTAFQSQGTAFVGGGPTQPETLGGGIWVRGIGGSQTTTANVTSTSNFPGLLNCNDTGKIKTRTNFGGVQLGADIAKFQVGVGTFHFGLTTGYAETRGAVIGTDSTVKSQIPFFGLYGVYSNGGFFADGLIRSDFYHNRSDFPTAGIFDQGFNGHSVNAIANLGYRFNLAENWFLEPSVGVSYSRTHIDPLNISGTLILATSPGIAPPGTLTVSPFSSVLGRASLRVGTTFVSGGVAYQPFATFTILHEFASDVRARVASNFENAAVCFPFACGDPRNNLTTDVSVSRVGTYGQIGLGLAAQVLDSGFVGYVRADFRAGPNIHGYSINAGLRYSLGDKPSSTRLTKGHAPAVVTHNWTGLRIGADLGTLWGQTQWNYVINGAGVNPPLSGGALGARIGYDHQFGAFVIGAEASLARSNARGDRACPNAFFWSCEASIDTLSTVTARAGFGWGDLLLYGKAGVAFASYRVATQFNPRNQPLVFIGAPAERSGSTRRTESGLTLGMGAELALSDRLTARAEYSWYNFGSHAYRVDNGLVVNARANANQVKVGLSYQLF